MISRLVAPIGVSVIVAPGGPRALDAAVALAAVTAVHRRTQTRPRRRSHKPLVGKRASRATDDAGLSIYRITSGPQPDFRALSPPSTMERSPYSHRRNRRWRKPTLAGTNLTPHATASRHSYSLESFIFRSTPSIRMLYLALIIPLQPPLKRSINDSALRGLPATFFTQPLTPATASILRTEATTQ